MKISIIGTGYVGLTTGACLAERGHAVLCVDQDREKIALLRRGKMPIFEPGLESLVKGNVRAGRLSFGTSNKDAVAHGKVIFMCVATPPRPDGSADLSAIEAVARDIAGHLKEFRLVAEKSTVPVATGSRVKDVISKYRPQHVDFEVASNPEFLREGCAIEDTMNPDRIVIGVESKRAETILREVYKPFKAPVLVTDIMSAELIKHASNAFLAMKISFANAVGQICELAGANVVEVTRGVGMDRRIGPGFLNAGIGYGGSCFPKDVAAFEAISRELGYDFSLLREVQRVNEKARDLFVKKVERELWIVKDKTIAALGLSFKANTDDIRESVAIKIIRMLVEKGAKVRAYDPQALAKARASMNTIAYCRSPYEAARGADAALVLTDWEEFRALDFGRLKKVMAHPTILDGRNLLDPGKMRELGFTYRSIGRP
ncbi:MAG: UDP-glucose/GDP-mannose dehydrogenase family protein [Planctomycetes bacterium]|nr:UDP-glucose/GDP-mannose dehydrogenase family protein [Planctomycetota bacterium]